MADIKADAIWSLSSALGSSDAGETQRTAQATVSRIDMDGTIWVRLVGSDADTPANGGSTAEVAPNDAVTVSIENGRCRITGCTSAPSTSSRAVDGKIEPIADTAKAADAAATAAQTAAAEAANVANAVNQHFFADGNGVHVSTDEGDPAGAQNIIMNSAGVLLREQTANLAAFTPSAVSFYDGNGNQAANVTATFGTTGATIGKVGAAHSVIDADGQRFYASDGSTQLANIGYGEAATQSGTATMPYYTFGTRAANATIGGYSVAEGQGAKASGYLSHAQNSDTIAAKTAQTSLGAFNLEDTSTTTTHPSGVVSYGKYAVIVGNGSGNNYRSNALTVDWLGNVECGTVNGFDLINTKAVWYSVCSTGASDAAKVAISTGFTLETGAVLFMRASADQRAIGELTLNVNATGAKTVYANGKVTSSTNGLVWHGGDTLVFVYDGTYWRHVSGGAPAPSYIAVRLSANTAMSFSSTYSYSNVPFNTLDVQYGGDITFYPASHYIAINEAGWYRISGNIAANAPYYAQLYVGGTILNTVISNQSAYLSNGFGSYVWYCPTGTQISIRLAKSTSANPTVGGERISMLTVERVR